MKTQLLQDIGESQVFSVPPQAGTAPAHDASQPQLGEPVREPEAGKPEVTNSPAFSVWKARTQPMPDPPPEPEVRPAPASAADMGWRHEPLFAAENMDRPGMPAAQESHWFDRWGRKAVTWTSGLAAAVLLAGGGTWMYQLGKQERALALLAKSPIPAREAGRLPAVFAPAADAQPAPAASMPVPAASTVLVPPPFEPVAAVRPVAESPPQAAATLDADEPDVAAPRVASVRAPSAKPKRVSRKPAAKTVVADARTKAARSRLTAETLRQCRAVGYHAAKCAQRRCEVTKYGLVCRG